MKAAVSSISLSEAIDGPRMWNTVKVSCPFFAASRKPMSRSDRSVGDSRPARMSITVTCASALDSVSKIFIWSATEVMSTTSVMSGWKRFSVPLGDFGVEGAGRHVVGDEIIEQRARDRGLADAALVRSYQNHRWLCHGRSLPGAAVELRGSASLNLLDRSACDESMYDTFPHKSMFLRAPARSARRVPFRQARA